ncbi:hypothetical protein [Gimesia aquarii]|uniref:Uncharacterized protein n=1 Tax=Gimesia aquarii TaxID=2527964 RepID=A0A517VW11_9PLAN|nr:hypothetical protein [Gimesia aquarii]QDT97191.1 hypothetical protein V144x_26620 [Gimesia aquarii]
MNSSAPVIVATFKGGPFEGTHTGTEAPDGAIDTTGLPDGVDPNIAGTAYFVTSNGRVGQAFMYIGGPLLSAETLEKYPELRHKQKYAVIEHERYTVMEHEEGKEENRIYLTLEHVQE